MSTVPKWWSPRLWGAHLLLIVVLATTIALGYWQWHVSRDHRAKQVAEYAHATPRPLAEIYGHDDPFPGSALGRPALISGVWVNSSTLYVQQPGGYWVITPIAVGGAGQPAIYVVRGFSATTQAPAVSGSVSVVGWLEPDDENGDADVNPSDDVIPQLQLSLAAPHVSQDIYDGYAVVADKEATWATPTANDGTAGLTPVPAPAAPKADPTTGLRNLLYAFEWWIFALLAIYIWWRYLVDQLHPKAGAGTEAGAGPGEGQGDGPDSAGAPEQAVPSKP